MGASGIVIYERLLLALPDSVPHIRRDLDSVLERHGVNASRREDIALMVSEAATNAVLHAYPGAGSGPLYVAGTLDRDAVTISVCDSGRGLTPDGERGGLGAGLGMMMRLADHLEISSDATVHGTCVCATFDHATAVAAEHQPARAARERGEMLPDYLRVLSAAHDGLTEDTQAVLAQAQHALARSRRVQQERSHRR